MRLRFWGTRGSLPVALTAPQLLEKVARSLFAASGMRFANQGEAQRFASSLPFELAQTHGGHTSCVEIELAAPSAAAHTYVLCDLGSGARPFAQSVLARHGPRTANTFHVFLSHLHWDHIMGFPFFTPAYIPGNIIHLYGGHADIELALRRQQDPPSFPVPLAALGAQIHYHRLTPGQPAEIAGMTVHTLKQRHGGDSYGYRFEHQGKVAVYSTDSEHRMDDADETETFAEFFRRADAVVFDAMYSLADAMSVKADWGHSSNVVGVELCQLAEAKQLVLFHHEPVFGDAQITGLETEARRLESITREGRAPLQVIAAYDGLELAL